MEATMSNLLKHLCVLDLASGKYETLLNCIGASWSWKEKEGGEYEVTGQFGGSMRRGDYSMAEKYLTNFLKSHGIRMHDEAIGLGLAVIVADIEEYCGLAGIKLVNVANVGGVDIRPRADMSNMLACLKNLG